MSYICKSQTKMCNGFKDQTYDEDDQIGMLIYIKTNLINFYI